MDVVHVTDDLGGGRSALPQGRVDAGIFGITEGKPVEQWLQRVVFADRFNQPLGERVKLGQPAEYHESVVLGWQHIETEAGQRGVRMGPRVGRVVIQVQVDGGRTGDVEIVRYLDVLVGQS